MKSLLGGSIFCGLLLLMLLAFDVEASPRPGSDATIAAAVSPLAAHHATSSHSPFDPGHQPPSLKSYSYGFLSGQVSKGESRDAFGNVRGGYLVDDGHGSRQYNYYQTNVPVSVPLVARTLASVSSSLPGTPSAAANHHLSLTSPVAAAVAGQSAAAVAGRLLATRSGLGAFQQQPGIHPRVFIQTFQNDL
jgi:hypothetical protein